MDEPTVSQPESTPPQPAAPAAAPAPAAPKEASLVAPLVMAILLGAVIIGGSIVGSVVYLGDRLGDVKAQLGDLGGAAGPHKPGPSDQGDEAPQKVDGSKLLSKSDPWRGTEGAPVTVIEFSDYQCPFCGRFFEETLPTLLATYKDKIRFVYKDFPLPMHSDAQKAAEAARCAGDQNKYWEFHDGIFKNQGSLSIDSLKELAGRLGLDRGKFDSCLTSGKHAPAVKENVNVGRAAGVNGTPTFFINGERLVGAQPIEEFKKKIDVILAK